MICCCISKAEFIDIMFYQLPKYIDAMQHHFLNDLFKRNISLINHRSLSATQMTEIFTYTSCRQLSQFLAAVIFFHASEYALSIYTHGRTDVTLNSLLISRNYIIAMIVSILEYFLELTFFPGLKSYWWISNIGLTMVITGEIIRKMAIVTAGRSFTHLIKVHHEEHHRLIKHGIYGFVRHPAYCGFFIWSVGSQIMLVNPICTVGFAVVVWKFFAGRIPYEEFFLRQFFDCEYDEYAESVPSGVPFVK